MAKFKLGWIARSGRFDSSAISEDWDSGLQTASTASQCAPV